MRDLEDGRPINSDSVQKLQTALHAKAKASGYGTATCDKISREDILACYAGAAPRARRAWTVGTSRCVERTGLSR